MKTHDIVGIQIWFLITIFSICIVNMGFKNEVIKSIHPQPTDSTQFYKAAYNNAIECSNIWQDSSDYYKARMNDILKEDVETILNK